MWFFTEKFADRWGKQHVRSGESYLRLEEVDEGCSEGRPGPPQGWSGLARTSRRAVLAGRTAGGQMRAEVSKKEVSGQREVGFN